MTVVGCVHGNETSCARWCLRTFVKSFVVGAGSKTLLNVLLFLAFRRGKLTITLRLVGTLLDVRYGLFLGTYSTAWKLVSCLIRTTLRRQHLRQEGGGGGEGDSGDGGGAHSSSSAARARGSLAATASCDGGGAGDETHTPHEHKRGHGGCSDDTTSRPAAEDDAATTATAAAAAVSAAARRRERYLIWAGDMVAGAASGLALYWLPRSHRKGLALYFFTRSGEFLARYLSSRRLLPAFIEQRVAPHLDVALMTLSAAQILYSYIMERDTLDPTYSSFLIKFGGKDVRVIDSIAPMRRGGTINRAMFLEWAREHQLKDIMGVLFGLHHYVICDIIHPGTDCFSHFVRFTYEAFWRALPMYATLHTVTTGVVLLVKLRNFVVAHGYHHRAIVVQQQQQQQQQRQHAHHLQQEQQEQELLLLVQLPEEEPGEAQGERDKRLALRPDESMRAHHDRGLTHHDHHHDGDGYDDRQEQEEGEARDDVPTTKRKLGRRELSHMARCSVVNLWAHLRHPGHARALVRFVLSQVLTRLALNIMRSSLFLGLYCASGWLGACIAQRLFLMRDVRWFYPWLALPGLASLVEAPTRRRELALYCVPKALESCCAVLHKYDMWPSGAQYLRDGEVFLFSAGSALTLFCYVNGKQSIKPTFLRLMNWLWA